MANSKWKKLVVGTSTIITNGSYPPVLSSTPTAYGDPRNGGGASISADEAYNPGVSYSEGDLLFYTDGHSIYDSLGALMDGSVAGSVAGGSKVAQSCVILKSSVAHYYWIIVNCTDGKIRTHTVLMTGNSGRGTISLNSSAVITTSSAPTDRFNGFYSTSTSQYGVIGHEAGTNKWHSYVITGLSSNNPVWSSVTTTTIGNTYANNDAANHACLKFNAEGTKMATVYQSAIGTSSVPVTTAIVEVYDFNPTTGVPSNFSSFTVPINDAGAVAPGRGNDGRVKAYDLEWAFESSTLYVPIYDENGLGVNWYTLNASNVVTSQGTVTNSQTGVGSNPDKAILGMYKDPYSDNIFLTKPAVIGSTGGYSSNYNDTYATNYLSVITNVSTPASSEFIENVAFTSPGDTIGKGMPTRPIATEAAGISNYYTLTPCDSKREYIMDTDGGIWVFDNSLSGKKIADVSSITNRINITVQKETNFIYLLAGTGATPKIYKIDPVTGTADAGTTVSGTSITAFNSICSKDGDSLKLYAVITISGPHYNYAEIVIATGTATKTAGNTSHVAVDTAYIGSTLYMASGDDLYKNTGPGTWATVGANGLSTDYEGLSTDDTTLYGYIAGKRYTINTSTGAATLGKSLTINEGANTWNYTAQGAGIVNIASITTDDTSPGDYIGTSEIITVTNFAGCYRISTAGSGSTAIGDITSNSSDCAVCNYTTDGGSSGESCKLLISCCDSGYDGLSYTREIVGVTSDITCTVGNYYEITGGNQTSDQLNRCVLAEQPDDSLYMTFANSDAVKINITSGVLETTAIKGGNDIAFNKHGVGFISTGGTLDYTIPSYGSTPSSNSTTITPPQHTAMSFNYSDQLITGGIVGGVTQVSRSTIDKKGVITTSSTLTNATVLLNGDIAVDKISGTYYCTGDSTPSTTEKTTDLFSLDPSTLAETHIADLVSTLSLTNTSSVKAIEIVRGSAYVLTWDTALYTVTLYEISLVNGGLIKTIPLKYSTGEYKFTDAPTGLGANNPCRYWDAASFQFTTYESCSKCFASTTSKNCCFELVDCETGASTIVTTDVSAYLGQIVVTDTPGKCYTVYAYDNSSACTGSEVNITKQYTSCSDCTGIQTVCYRLLKCGDTTSDPKYTTTALTPLIQNKVGKVVVLEGESFCRSVDAQGNAVELYSAAAQTIKHTRPSCSKCNFFLKLKQYGSPNIVRYVDYGFKGCKNK